MDDTSLNHYEQQLYSVFKSFDVDNEEALDKPAVVDLCTALQLDDRGESLVESLFDRNSDRVTFAQFRNGLLSVLGSEESPSSALSVDIAESTNSLHAHSDDDSSGREVAPKFIFGSKKYGRRSRPHRSAKSSESPSPRASSDSRIGTDNKSKRDNYKRSASVIDDKSEYISSSSKNASIEINHNKKINYEEALLLCQNLKMDSIDHEVIKQIFNNLSSHETTVGEFFDRLNLILASTITSSTYVNDIQSSNKYANSFENVVPTDIVIDAWELAGVEQPKHLLHDLGFGSTHLSPHILQQALEDEMRALPLPADQPESMLLLSYLALCRLRVQKAHHNVGIISAERDKLRVDLNEANRRAQLLAQDVDESHSKIEAELKHGLRLLELRHTEASRAASAELAEEREKAFQLRKNLENQITQHLEMETRLRTENDLLLKRCEDQEQRVSVAEQKTLNAECEIASLVAELKDIKSRDEHVEKLETARVQFTAQLDELIQENKSLRDRNDELCAELEAYTRRGDMTALGSTLRNEGASWCDETAAVHPQVVDQASNDNSLIRNQHNEDCESSLVSLDQKVYGRIEMLRKFQSIIDIVKTVPTAIVGCESCTTLKGIVNAIQKTVGDFNESVILLDQLNVQLEETIDSSVQTEPQEASDVVLTDEHIEKRHEEEKQRLENLVKDLESSLDQLKLEYDKCEEYWASKLDEERDLHNEEQRSSDERLAELIVKIGEYEQQFAGGRLPAIEEARNFETQVNGLQEEFTMFRNQKQNEIEDKNKEIVQLRERIEALERKSLAVSPNLSHQAAEKRAVRNYTNPAFTRSASTPIAVEKTEQSKCLGSHEARPSSTVANEIQEMIKNEREVSRKGSCVACGVCDACSVCASLVARARAGRETRGSRHAREARESAELRSRLVAAERAVTRLHGRLAAADLLVKDLYIENCHLAHAPRQI